MENLYDNEIISVYTNLIYNFFPCEIEKDFNYMYYLKTSVLSFRMDKVLMFKWTFKRS